MNDQQKIEALWRAREVKAAPKPKPDFFADSFPEQRAFALDQSPLKAGFCTRRAAKSFSWGLEAINDSYGWPTANYLFLGLVREEAKRIFWKDVLKVIDRKHELGMRFNETSLTATMANGATIYIGAADANEDEMRKLLGQKYRKVCVDEIQDWKHTDPEQLIFHTLKPAMADFHGSISATGTAGLVSTGFFRSITPDSVRAGIKKGSPLVINGFSVHCWDTHSNTSVMADGRTMREHWAQEIAELVAMKPGIEQTAWFRRNYLGEWVVDEDALVYRYQPGRNDFNGTLPNYRKGSWHYVLGCDLGYEDPTAFVPMAYHDNDRTLYLLESIVESGMDLTAVANQAKALDRKYGFEVFIVDGANKQAVEEMVRRHDVPWKPADKTGKADFIELMNAEWMTGGIKLDPSKCAPLAKEYQSLIWDQKKLRDGVRAEDARCSNHATDGANYGWRFCFPYMSQALAELPPKVGTPEWQAAHLAKMAEADERIEQDFLDEGDKMDAERREREQDEHLYS